MSLGAQAVRSCTSCGAVYRAEYPRCVNDGAELVLLSHDPLVGTTIGPYVVDALVGEGGMGRVYRVHHARLPQKRLALKVLLGDYAATPAMRARFAQEAQSASRLSHPNVVGVCDFGVTDAGLAYLAMDLVEGTPLSLLITHQPMAPGRVIHLARQLCLGLAHAHDHGLIHRDFKPDNIIVVREPAGEVPRIADFGLAITTDASDIRLTTGGVVLGTPAYVAPEQCTGGDVDHRADLYALGVTLFELLSGGLLPFDGDPAEVVGLKAAATPPTIADLAPDVEVPPALAAIVDRLIAPRPEDRYPDAHAVLEALDRAVRLPDEVPPAPALEPAPLLPLPLSFMGPAARRLISGVHTERVREQWRSHRGHAMLAGAIVLAGILVGGAVLLTRSTGSGIAEPPVAFAAPPAPAPAELPPPPLPPAPAPAPAGPPEATPRAPEPPPAAPIALEPRLVDVDVRGSLPTSTVRRAIERVLPEARACLSLRAGAVEIRFRIGEARRAVELRATGLATSRCLASVLSAVRTEAAPDVGDVEVRVELAYGKSS